MTNTSNIVTNALASFSINGTGSTGDAFTYDVSMDRTKKNFLPRVFGSSVQDKRIRIVG